MVATSYGENGGSTEWAENGSLGKLRFGSWVRLPGYALPAYDRHQLIGILVDGWCVVSGSVVRCPASALVGTRQPDRYFVCPCAGPQN